MKSDPRFRQLVNFWNWLPAFRAVAETENVHEAARIMLVSPSALSRMVRLLEAVVGHSLFHREGRRLRLSDNGRALLVSTRIAMRTIDDALHGEAARNVPLNIGVSGLAAELRAMRVMLSHGSQHGFSLRACATADQNAALLAGELDFALSTSLPMAHPSLESAMLHEPSIIRCVVARSHPLARVKRVTPAALAAHPFVLTANDQEGEPWSKLPAGAQLRLRCQSWSAAVTATQQGGMVGVFPADVIEAFGLAKALVAVAPPIATLQVYIIRRVPLTSHQGSATQVWERALALPRRGRKQRRATR